MTNTQLISAADLEFDFADRLRKALRLANLNATQLADALEVHRNATNSWINGKHMPRPRDIKKAAEVTGVPVEWLVTGNAPVNDGGAESRLRDLNPRPVLYEGTALPLS